MARVPVGNGSGVAAPRGDVAPVLPWYFRSPLPSAGADKKRDNHQIIYRFFRPETLIIHLNRCIIISSKGE